MDTHTTPPNQSSSTAPMPSSSTPHHLQQPHPSPTLSHPHPVHIPKPSVFYVPPNARQVLDFSQYSPTPESKAKRAVLSEDPNQNAIAVVGMGGAGKTTILRALGRHEHVWAKFSDGVWFIQLAHNATVQTLLEELEDIVTEALPDFLPNFTRLAAKPSKHLKLMNMLIDRLAPKRFLLIFDDVWDLDANVFKLVDAVCTGVQKMEGMRCKVLSSTRNEAIGRIPTHDVSIAVGPEDWRGDRCVDILCCYSGIDKGSIGRFAPRNRDALESIIEMCDGLPLALSVAGSAMQDVLGRGVGGRGENGILQYWESLQANCGQLSVAEGGSRHGGLKVAVETSLWSLEKKWMGEGMTVGEMFHSFCIVQKQKILPLSAIKKLWGVSDVLCAVRMFSRHSLVSLVEDEDGMGVGVRLHDLVHDMCVEKAEEREGVRFWHKRLVDGYGGSIMGSESSRDGVSSGAEVGSECRQVEWWNVDSNDKYIVDNVVRHLLGAGQATEALGLLIDYRWVERVNDDKNRAPFQMVMSNLKSVRSYVMEHEKTETGKNVARDIDVLVKAMELCMVPYCMKNREECTFQLFGRLRDVRSASSIIERPVCGIEQYVRRPWARSIVERLVCSIKQYGRRPWARSGPGVLTSGGSSLRRVLDLENSGMSMCIDAERDEVVVGGRNGNVWVYNGRDGTKKMSLVGHSEEDDVIGLYFDRSSEIIYSCSSRGRVVVWKMYKISHSFQTKEMQQHETIRCMQVLPKRGRVVLGTSKGRLVVVDVESGCTTRTIKAHGESVSSLTAEQREDVVVSGSCDGTIRAWGAKKFDDTENVLNFENNLVNSVTLSGDGRLLASGRSNGVVQMFNMETRRPICSCYDQHRDWVTCVLFSEDSRLLYSASRDGAIRVWRLSDNGKLNLAHALRHSKMTDIRSMCIGDGSELLALNWGQVYVWDARVLNTHGQLGNAFDSGVDEFVVSADEATMLTFCRRLKKLEILDIRGFTSPYIGSSRGRLLELQWLQRLGAQTLLEPGDPIAFIFDFPDFENCPKIFAVSNDRKYVAIAEKSRCVVHVYNNRGTRLYTLSDVEESALASIGNQQGTSTSTGRSGDCNGPESDKPTTRIDSLWFSSDGSTVSAVTEAEISGEDGESSWVKSKPISWDVRSGAVLSGSHVDIGTNASNSIAGSRTNCEERSPSLSVDRCGVVTCEHDGKCLTIATLEHEVSCWHYCRDMSRLLFVKWGGGLFYIDLVTDNYQPRFLDYRSRIQRPLPQLDPSPLHDMNEDTEEVYDVFISHAGPDKWTIAKPLYDLLVALGLKVFLDMAELRPGQHAPRKMIRAMRSAKIAVVILSPEFAARKWTMKELICFLERSGVGGERGVIIIPVFYRLPLDGCKDQNLLVRLKNEDGENALAADGFLERMGKEGNYGMKEIMDALRAVTVMTGIENKNGVGNGKSARAFVKRKEFVGSIGDAVVEANGRLKNGRAAGRSGSQE